MFRLYREPEKDELTVIGADVADGGSDYCAAVAKSKKHNDSFMVFHARMDSAQYGHELHKMCKFIQSKTGIDPLLLVERNVGMATIYVLEQLNYKKLFRMPKLAQVGQEDSEKIGWVTTGGATGTRQMMLDELAQSLRQHTDVIPDEKTVRELSSFVRKPNGKPEASTGTHDDLVIAEAIAIQGLKYVKRPHDSWKSDAPTQELFDEYGVPTV